MHVRLFGFFTTRSPLSHIGESISTVSYLVQEPILQPDGTLEDVFCYSGNAWRGQLRDLAATYMLERLHCTLGMDAFHLLFSGGRIGGEQSINITQARQLRRTVPMLSMWGGGVGNQILPGKLRVSNCYPICREAAPALPLLLTDEAAKVSYRGLTFEKSFSRKDDAKNEQLQPHLQDAAMLLLEGPAKKREGPADQMRMTAELLVTGVRLYTEIECLDCSEVELGALVSALHSFSRSPHIGGQANKGHGRVNLAYHWLNMDTGEEQPFLAIDDGPALLSHAAGAAKEAYDQHLRAQYDAMLAQQGDNIRALLGAA